MKKIIFTFHILLLAVLADAQSCFWHENFDAPSFADSVISYSSAGNPGWNLCSRLQTSLDNSDSAYVGAHDTIALRTTVMDFTGLTFVLLDFNQICKTDFFDLARLEYSTNGGVSFNAIPCSMYLGAAPLCAQSNLWSHASYGQWAPAVPGAIADNTWWRHESYDISSIAALQSNFVLRWIAYDSNAPDTAAIFPLNGWKLDDICVTAAPCELTAPTVTQNGSLQGTVYFLGPYTVSVNASDNSGIATANLVYTLNGGAPVTVPMTNMGGNTYNGIIPAVNDSDTLCYYVQIIDSSCNSNTTFLPPSGCIQFVASSGITYPYCDNFDVQTDLWSDSTISLGSIWEVGTPAFGATTGAHSAPNAWDINLTTGYLDNANAVLYSPVFGPLVPGAKLSFWHNYNTELGWDGTRIEYSVDGTTWAILGIVGDPNATNWYNSNANCSGQPAWNGNSGGWVNPEYNFPNTFNGGNFGSLFMMRFIFCSDPSVTGDGYSFDDICLTLPQPFDIGVAAINQPGLNATAGQCIDVIVTIQNFGLNPLTATDIYWTDGTTTFGPTPWTGNLAPGASAVDTLTTCFPVPTGNFSLCAYTVMPNDGNQVNDTLCMTGVGVPVVPLSYSSSYCDNFDGANAGWLVITSGTLTTEWQVGSPNYGQTNSAHSAPNAWDINLNTPYDNNANTILYSPFFDFSNAVDTKLDMWMNFNSEAGWDGVTMEYSIGGGAWTILTGIISSTVNWYNGFINCSGNNAWNGSSGGWINVQHNDLNLFNNLTGTVQFRFTFCSDASVTYDGFSIDDFCLTVPVPLTASPVTIMNNTAFPLIFTGQPVVYNSNIQNMGTTPLSNVVACLYVDGGLVVCDTMSYAPALAQGSFQNHVFSQPWIATPGTHTVCVITSFPNQGTDQNPSDDTICSTIQVIDTIGVTTSSPYCNDFEGGAQWVTLNSINYGPNTSWQTGVPAQPPINTAHSGTKVWMTGLAANYPNRDTSSLFTPAFNVQAGKNYRLSFWQMFRTEVAQDGGNVEYSVDYGNSWQLLGAFGDPLWYNAAFVTALGGNPPAPGWSGNSTSAWDSRNHDICLQQDGSVMFRFKFASDFSGNDIGWAIDDFCFEDLGTTCPLAVEEISNAAELILGQNHPNPANGMTAIDYYLPAKGNVKFQIVNLLGQVMDTPVNGQMQKGRHTVEINGAKLAPGIYYYSIAYNNDERLVKKMVITR